MTPRPQTDTVELSVFAALTLSKNASVVSIPARVFVRSIQREQTCGKFMEFKQKPEKFTLSDN